MMKKEDKTWTRVAKSDRAFADGVYLPSCCCLMTGDRRQIFKNTLLSNFYLKAEAELSTAGGSVNKLTEGKAAEKAAESKKKADEHVSMRERWAMSDEFDCAITVFMQIVTFWTMKDEFDRIYGVKQSADSSKSSAATQMDVSNYKYTPIMMHKNGRHFEGPYDALLLHCFRAEMRRLKDSSNQQDQQAGAAMEEDFKSASNWGVGTNKTTGQPRLAYFLIPTFPALSHAITAIRDHVPWDSIANLDTLALKIMPNKNGCEIDPRECMEFLVTLRMKITYIHPMVSWIRALSAYTARV